MTLDSHHKSLATYHWGHRHPWLPTAVALAPLPVPGKAPPSNLPVHPPPTAGTRPPLRPNLGRFRASSSFLPPFPPQQAKVRKQTAHLQNSRRHVWKKLTQQPAVQERLVAGACLGVSTERVTVGRKRSTGPRWGPLASPLAPTVAMPWDMHTVFFLRLQWQHVTHLPNLP